jgi:hypothetical protein
LVIRELLSLKKIRWLVSASPLKQQGPCQLLRHSKFVNYIKQITIVSGNTRGLREAVGNPTIVSPACRVGDSNGPSRRRSSLSNRFGRGVRMGWNASCFISAVSGAGGETDGDGER